MYTLPEMFKLSLLSGVHLPFVAPGRKAERRRGRRSSGPLPWKFALPLIVALSLALWMAILFAAERLITAII
jgi:hypothetical protein